MDGDIVFGRPYYPLGPKYFYRKEDNSVVHFFTRDIEPGKDVIHFPYMAAVLADLRAEEARHDRTNWLSVAAIVVALFAALLSIFS